jgi:hypothetical protein
MKDYKNFVTVSDMDAFLIQTSRSGLRHAVSGVFFGVISQTEDLHVDPSQATNSAE